MSREIRLAVVGVGNCASALLQGVARYRAAGPEETRGIMHPELGGYRVTDIHPVAAFDVDARKVGRDVADACLAPPNIAYALPGVTLAPCGVPVQKGPVLDGVPDHLTPFVEVHRGEPVDVVRALRESGAEVMLNCLPTGSTRAARYYADAALEAGAAFVNGMPEVIVGDPAFGSRALARGVPAVGDDVKSQFGATILHRALIAALLARGIHIHKSYQLNYAGNTDFVNLVRRGATKERTKTDALTSLIPYDAQVSPGFAYVGNMGDRKTARVLVEGANFGGAPLEIEVKLEVEDSANFAGTAADAIRCCRVARDRGIGGVLEAASAWLMKAPPTRMPDEDACRCLEAWLAGARER